MRIDLHTHSTASDGTDSPAQLVRTAADAGLDVVAITDHDTISGSLLIADLPGAFISEQVTTYFPQDPCKIHLLVWGITEAQHSAIATLRENIFDLQAYLQQQQIAHDLPLVAAGTR